MARARREPPVLFTPAICKDPERLAKALQMNMDFLSQEVAAGVEDTMSAVSNLADEVISEDDMGELVTGTIVSELPYLGSEVDPTAPIAAPVVIAGQDFLSVNMEAHTRPVDFLSFGVQVSYNGGGSWTDFWRTSATVVTYPTLSYTTTHRFKYSVRTVDQVDSAYSPESADYSPLQSPIQQAEEDEISTDETRNNATYGDLTTVGPRIWIQAPVSRKVLVFNSCTINSNTGTEPGRQSYEVAHVIADGSTTLGGEGVTHSPLDSYAAVVANPDRVKSCDINQLTLTTAGNWYMFTCKYQRDGAAAVHFRGRQLVVFPL